MNVHQMSDAGRNSGHGKRGWIWIVGAALLLLIAGGIWYFISSIKPPEIKKPPVTEDDPGEETDGDNYLDIKQNGQREGVYTFIVAGVDKDHVHTDVLMLVTYDTVKNKVNVMSIPRDTFVNNGHTGASKKINAAYGRIDGIDNTIEEVYGLTGIKANRYAVTTFGGFAGIIDAIGGVEFDVPRNMRYTDRSQDLYINIKKGLQTLDGETAVELVRYRQYLTGDVGRIDMTQQFLKAVASQVLEKLDALNILSIASILLSETKTNLTIGEITWFAKQIGRLKDEDITFLTLPGEGGPVDKISFYLPDRAGIIDMVNTYMNPYEKEIPDSAFDVAEPPYNAY